MISPLTILFAPGTSSGAVKTSRSVAKELLHRGHRIVFTVDKRFDGQLERYGFEEVLHSVPELEQPTDAELWRQFVWKNSEALKGNAMEIIDGFVVKKFEKQLAENKALDKHFRSIIAIIRPDVIVIDSFMCSPTLTSSGIPWVNLFSGAPSYLLDDPQLPPPFSGIPTKPAIIEKWAEFRQKYNEKISHIWYELNDWYLSLGGPQMKLNRLNRHSPYLNIYMTPEELDLYSSQTLLPENWARVDCLMENDDLNDKEFKLPSHMLANNTKLILVNMGSVGTEDQKLMQKIIGHLKRSEHMYIIVTGIHYGKYELANNMWEQASIPMSKLMPKIDLVINSGSNYSVCEAFHFGKPMIVLPLYGDQIETAQRVKETHYGLILNPYTCCVTLLVASIDALLDDMAVTKRALLVCERMKKTNNISNAANYIEKLF